MRNKMKLATGSGKNPVAVAFLVIMVLLIGLNFSCKKNTAVDDNNNNNNNNQTPVEGIFYGNIAFNFSENDQTGKTFTLKSLKGKVILLNFSAMWCGPCRNEASHLMELYNTYKERGLEIVQCIFQDEDGNPADLDDIGRWLATFGITFRVLQDPDYSTVNSYSVSSIPLNILIGRDFIIVYRMAGFDKAAIIQRIEDAL